MRVLQWLLSEGSFSPMALCLAYDPFTVTWLAFANGAIVVSYAAIWVQLAVLFRRLGLVQVVAFTGRPWVLALFGTLLLASGIGHVIMLVDLQHAFFRLEAAWRLVTASLSVTTAAMMSFMVRLQPDDAMRRGEPDDAMRQNKPDFLK